MNQHIRRGIFKLALAGAFAISATASPAASALAVTTGGGMITTVAGATRTAPVGLRGSETSLFYPQGAMGLYALGVQPPGGGWYSTPVKIGIDAAGNLYIPDTLNNRVLKLSLGPSGTTRDGMISLVAGTGAGGYSGDGGPATAARLWRPLAAKPAPDGSVYIAESGEYSPPAATGPGVPPGATAGRRVRKVDPQGIITTYAGNGLNNNYGNDGPATNAGIRSPAGLDLGPDGSLYVSDIGSNQVRRIAPNGMIFPFAGRGEGGGFDGEGGPAITAKFDGPSGIAAAPNGDVYIADRNNHRVRMVQASSGNIYTVAGTGSSSAPNTVGDFDPGGDPTKNFTGAANAARLNRPSGVDIGPDGSLYIAEHNSHLVRRVMPKAVARQVFGLSDDLPDITIYNTIPIGRIMTVAGMYDAGGPTLQGTKTITNVGGFFPGDMVEGANLLSTQTPLRNPTGVAVAPDGTLYVLDQGNEALKRVEKPGKDGGLISRVAGQYHGSSGGPHSTQLLQPRSVAVGPDGSLYVADTDSAVVRKVSPDGSFSQVIAGNGITGTLQIAGEIGQGATMQIGTVATETSLNQPAGVAVAGDGTVYIADRGSHVVVKVTPDGIMYVVAGTGVNGFQTVRGGGTTEGKLATQEELNYPSGVAVGPHGNIYIADTDNNRIRRVTPDGLIFTVAGIGSAGFSGDGGPATGAELDHPTDTGIDAAGNVYIADRGNARIRKVDASGIITTIAGTGANGFGGDGGPATSAMLNNPESVTNPDVNGAIYIADRDNQRVRRVTPDGVFSTVAGTGSAGEGGEFGRSPSPAATAQLRAPRGVGIGPDGALYIADSDNGQVRKVTFG